MEAVQIKNYGIGDAPRNLFQTPQGSLPLPGGWKGEDFYLDGGRWFMIKRMETFQDNDAIRCL